MQRDTVLPLPLLLFLLGLLLPAREAAAQFPGELRGHVLSAETGAPLEAALIELPSLGRSAVSDATGAFHLRGLEPGRYAVVVRRLGYVARAEEIEARNGRVARLRVALTAEPIELEGVQVTGARDPTAGTTLGRRAIERSGARTAGDVVRGVPGVVLRGEGADREQTASIRGSGSDAVLVLLDGVPINDPITGSADLSTIPAGSIESVTVLAGARSARYGPRAEAGVILIESRTPERGLAARGAAGSLGEWGLGAEAGGAGGDGGWSVGAHLREVEGGFEYERVLGVDARPVRRTNADVAERGAYGAVYGRVAGGELRARAGAERLERGLPGKGYAPSTRARQEMDRVRASLGWRRAAGEYSAGASLAGVTQRVHYADPDPPFGLPYDDATRVRSLDARAELERAAPEGWLRGSGAGLEATLQTIDSGTLSDRAPGSRADVGIFAHGTLGAELRRASVELTAEARLDRDDVASRWYPNRGVTLRLDAGALALHVANRSGFSPPSLGDQFFREGVAVAPNPDLEAERIPSEWEIGALLSGRLTGAGAAAGARLYQGDVKGMITWLPDFRFVWSPQNTDVRRRGVESWGELSWPERGVRLSGSYALAAVTYDRTGNADTVQVAYRPRHSAQLRGEWSRGPWSAGVGVLFTGTRYPAPAPLNPLAPFWTLDLNVEREWRLGAGSLTTALHVDRLLDEKESLIFGFPEAGRRIRLDVRLRLAEQPTSNGGIS